MMTNAELEEVVVNTDIFDDGRGWRPRTHLFSDRFMALLKKAVDDGYVTPIRGSWGHRLTTTGKGVLVGYNARKAALERDMLASGIDPKQTVGEMTDEDVAKFKAFMKARKA